MVNLSAYERVLRRFGPVALVHDALVAAVNKLVFFRLLIIYFVSERGAVVTPPPDLDIHRMTASELEPHRDAPALELPGYFLREASENGDECFGAFIDGELCGYAWYALKASTSSRGVTTHFAPDTAYAYKNLTLDAFRGRGIQKWIKWYCLDHYLARGKRGIIVAIESQNFASRRSTKGSGARVVGFWPFAMGKGWYWGAGTPGCRAVGYRLTDARGPERG